MGLGGPRGREKQAPRAKQNGPWELGNRSKNDPKSSQIDDIDFGPILHRFGRPTC